MSTPFVRVIDPEVLRTFVFITLLPSLLQMGFLFLFFFAENGGSLKTQISNKKVKTQISDGKIKNKKNR